MSHNPIAFTACYINNITFISTFTEYSKEYRRARDFPFFRSVQNGSGVQPVSHPVGARDIFSGVNWSRSEANHLPP
jgi:hypothetical protein